MKSTELLAADHEIILQSLRVLDLMAGEIRRGNKLNADDIHSLLDFLRNFADGCHHVKEEAIFFPALMQAGVPLDSGPLRILNQEHERGRALSSAMQEGIAHGRTGEFVRYADRYMELLSQHIDKENRWLFEKAEQILSDDEDERTAAAFEHFETTIVGTLAQERFRKTIEDLASKYLASSTVHPHS
jgi:hemerythrin-like domain-containing protein